MPLTNSIHIEERPEDAKPGWYLRHAYLQEDFLAQMPEPGPYESRVEAEAAAARTRQIIEIELFYPTEGH
jgi:hypothetical protein